VAEDISLASICSLSAKQSSLIDPKLFDFTRFILTALYWVLDWLSPEIELEDEEMDNWNVQQETQDELQHNHRRVENIQSSALVDVLLTVDVAYILHLSQFWTAS